MLRLYSFLTLLACTVLIWTFPTPSGLTVSFLDVGQGDAILIEGPTGVQILVDAGSGGAVLRELGTQLPFWDRSLDAVVATHPDQDHIGGFSGVLERYQVAYILEPGIPNSTHAWKSFVRSAETEFAAGAHHSIARAGQRLTLGGGAYADILYPDHDVSGVEDTNSGSIVMRVVYGDTAIMLTGDAPTSVEQTLFLQYGYGLDADILKAGHHGSKTSSSPDFVESVSPEAVVFSRGCNNRYGHPAPEVVQYFTERQITILDTCEEGSVTFYSDGVTLRQLF